jgi:hypothetical protein
MLRNDYTVPMRRRHRGGIVNPLGCKACRAIHQPISPSNQILDHSIQNRPKPVSFLSSGVSSESSLTPLNPTITHTQSPHLASIASLAGLVKNDFSARNYNRTFILPMISTEVSSLAAHNKNYFVAKPQQEFPATIWNAASCVRYNERVGQRWFRTKSQSHSLEWSISTQQVSSIFRV